MAEGMIPVQVCYADHRGSFLLALDVRQGTTIEQAIQASGILQQVPSIDLSVLKVGIFSKARSLDTVLRERDRVEIYPVLIADPKESRRKRAKPTVKKLGAPGRVK